MIKSTVVDAKRIPVWVRSVGGYPLVMAQDVHVSITPRSPVERKLQGALEEQLSSALQAAAHRIAEDYAGEPADRVCQRLLDEARSGLHPDIAAAFQPDRAELCQIAEAIVRGEYR